MPGSRRRWLAVLAVVLVAAGGAGALAWKKHAREQSELELRRHHDAAVALAVEGAPKERGPSSHGYDARIFQFFPRANVYAVRIWKNQVRHEVGAPCFVWSSESRFGCGEQGLSHALASIGVERVAADELMGLATSLRRHLYPRDWQEPDAKCRSVRLFDPRLRPRAAGGFEVVMLEQESEMLLSAQTKYREVTVTIAPSGDVESSSRELCVADWP